MKRDQRKPSKEYLSDTWVSTGACRDCCSIGEYLDGMCSSCGGPLTMSIDRRWIPPETKTVWSSSCFFPFIVSKVKVVKEGEWTIHSRDIK